MTITTADKSWADQSYDWGAAILSQNGLETDLVVDCNQFGISSKQGVQEIIHQIQDLLNLTKIKWDVMIMENDVVELSDGLSTEMDSTSPFQWADYSEENSTIFLSSIMINELESVVWLTANQLLRHHLEIVLNEAPLGLELTEALTIAAGFGIFALNGNVSSKTWRSTHYSGYSVANCCSLPLEVLAYLYSLKLRQHPSNSNLLAQVQSKGLRDWIGVNVAAGNR